MNVAFRLPSDIGCSMETLIPPKRRLRYERKSTGKRVSTTDRDLIWFLALQRHGPLPSNFLLAFTRDFRSSYTRSLERLGDLYHESNTPHGGSYLDRPRQQWNATAKFERTVYELAPAAERALEERGLAPSGHVQHRAMYHHRLMVSCITASIELAAKEDPHLRFIAQDEILARSPNKTLSIPCVVTYTNPRTGNIQTLDALVVPDAIFGLEYVVGGQRLYRFFMVEADRSHEPIIRANLLESSYLRKVLQYREVIGNGGYRRHFGMKASMLLLTVTTNARHMTGIMRMAQEVVGTAGCSYMLFRTAPEFGDELHVPDPTGGYLTGPWVRPGHSAALINMAAMES